MSEDPRVLRSREAILAAARVLLRDEGPSAITHQRVARAAAIGRATVYRHWSSPHELLLAVMADADLPFFQDPTTPVRPWLHQQLRRLADELTLPDVAAAALTLLQQAQWNPQLAQQREHFLAAITQRLDAAWSAPHSPDYEPTKMGIWKEWEYVEEAQEFYSGV